MNIIHQFENGFHAVAVDVENGVTSLLSKFGDKVTLHKFFTTGETVAQDLNIPLLRDILTAVDSLVPSQA